MRWPLQLASEWVILRRTGEQRGPYRNEVDARREYGNLRGASLYRRRILRPASYRFVEGKEWDEA